MGLFRLVAAACCATLALGCGPKGPAGASGGDTLNSLADLPAIVDAPYELAEDQDLQLVRKRFDAMPLDHPDRAATRSRLAAAYARTTRQVLDRGVDPDGAFEAMLSMLSLWTAGELEEPRPDLSTHTATLRRVRDYFARGGGDREATAALAALMVADPENAPRYRAEIDEIFAYADSLSVAQYGAGAERARPIEILDVVAGSLLSRYVVDRLSQLYRDRQKAIESRIRRVGGADISLIRAHGSSVLHTARNIVALHARSERLGEAPGAIEHIVGIGDDAQLRRKLIAALAPEATEKAWISLAQSYRDKDEDKDDPETALAIVRHGAAALPEAAGLHCLAAQNADAIDNVHIAIASYERCLALAPDTFEAASALAGLYEARMGSLVYSDRPRAALAELRVIEKFHAAASKRWPKKSLSHDLAAAYATVGRGLVSLGELESARKYLRLSIRQRPDFPALESLGTVALKLGQFADASRYFDLALRLPAGDLQTQFQRAKVLRLAAEAHAGAGNRSKAERYAEAALLTWRDVGKHGRLLDRFQGELHLERGKILWQDGNKAEALAELDRAVDADPDGSSTMAGVVAFLVVRNQQRRALDAYHRALGSYKVSDYFKVYMSLWVLAEARQRNAEPDSLAVQYLAGRAGGLWYDQLAEYATGRARVGALKRRATTRARRAELLYYTAVLSDAANDPPRARKLLEEVVATDMVTFFEYDMAKRWLERGLSAQRTTPASH